MTDEQINQRIAEACGWTDFVAHPEFGLMGTPPDTHGLRTAVDYYTVDLNAMHEAEKVIVKNYHIWTAYYYNIAAGTKLTAHATARKKAEAFLRALGKWNDQFGERTEMVEEVQQ
jgi:hypothetical protein